MLPIGLEIEVNNGPHSKNISNILLERDIANVKWNVCTEHCGYEYRTPILSSGAEIHATLNDIDRLKKLKLSFNNAGTHIHLGMWGVKKVDIHKSPYERHGRILTRQMYDLVGPSKDFIVKDFVDKKSEVFPAVRRMFIAASRFADVLRLVQHPDRWVNKYCHSIGSWDEKQIEKCKSIKNIASHQNLGQNHRRLSINPLSYQKWGTIEVRLIKASFDKKDIRDQIVLFSHLREACFDLDRPLPPKSGQLKIDFVRLLMDFCRIRGRTLIRLANNLDASFKTKTIPAICYNFDCQNYGDAETYTDYGLSRLVCGACEQYASYCATCGQRTRKRDMKKVDDLISGGRYVCNYACGPKGDLLSKETGGKKWSMGTMVGHGHESGSFNEVEKIKNVIKMSK